MYYHYALKKFSPQRNFKHGRPLKTWSFLSSEAQVSELVKQDRPVQAFLKAFYTSLIFEKVVVLSLLSTLCASKI